MEEVNKPSQEESNFKSQVDELANTLANLAKFRAEFFKGETRINVQIYPIPLESLEDEMTPMTISCTQSTIKKEQPLQEKGMSVQELVAKYMKEGDNMVKTSIKGQQKNLSSNLEVIKEKENLHYDEGITSRNDEELEKLQRVENDAQEWKVLVAKEGESTSPESHERTREEVVKTIPKMLHRVRWMRSSKLQK